MAITVYEHVESRELVNDRQYSGTTAIRKYVASSDNAQEDAGDINDAVANVAPDFYLRLIKQRIRPRPMGGGFWVVDVEYGPITGFDHPEGGVPGGQNIQLPDPLGMEFAFSTSGSTQHITKSLETKQSVGALFYGAPPSTDKAIGVSKSGVAGCDIIVPHFEFTITRQLQILRMSYIHKLVACTGCTNDRLWNTFEAGRVLFLGAEGSPIESNGLIKTWNVSYKFLVGDNLANVSVGGEGSHEIIIPVKKAHEYLWVGYTNDVDALGGVVMQVPGFAKVEKVYEEKDFLLHLEF